VRRAQLGKALAGTPVGVGTVYGPVEQVGDLLVAPEEREVLERQVNRSTHCARGTKISKFVALSLSA
jgi:hypothetical protein